MKGDYAHMDQQKIGMFLKTLRKEKSLTQEQFAEIFDVSNRTVSRWENGINLPDIELMILISDYYAIDLREIMDGERRSGKTDKETKETVIKAVDYTNEATKRYFRKQNWILLFAFIDLLLSEVLDHTSLLNELEYFHDKSLWFAGVGCALILLVIIASNTKLCNKVHKYRQRLLDEWINFPLGIYKR